MGWVETIHRCKTPNLQEVEAAEVQVGSVWECDADPDRTAALARKHGTPAPRCGDRWRLRQIKNEPGARGNVGDFPKWTRLTINGEPIPSEPSDH